MLRQSFLINTIGAIVIRDIKSNIIVIGNNLHFIVVGIINMKSLKGLFFNRIHNIGAKRDISKIVRHFHDDFL